MRRSARLLDSSTSAPAPADDLPERRYPFQFRLRAHLGVSDFSIDEVDPAMASVPEERNPD